MFKSTPEIRFALQAVRDACEMTRRVRSEMMSHTVTKSDASPVTLADFGVQAMVARGLSKDFPGDALVAEENAAYLKSREGKETLTLVTQLVASLLRKATPEKICDWIDCGQGKPGRRFWTLDPVDGTKGFLRGGQYVVALALIEDGGVKIGLLGCPNLNVKGMPENGGSGSLAVAVRGQGAWIGPLNEGDSFIPLRVSDRRAIHAACHVRSFEASHTDEIKMKSLVRTLQTAGPGIVMDSQAKHVAVAAGAGDLLFYLASRTRAASAIKVWDQAAGTLIVEEAGGRVTDLDGRALDFGAGSALANNRGVFCSNGYLHDPVLKILKGVL